MKIQRNDCGNKGFTLVELLVALLISGILMATVSSVLLMSQKIYTRGENTSYKQKSITNIETDLQNALATATAISTSTVAGSDYSIGFNKDGVCVEVIGANEYKTDQISGITLEVVNHNTMKYGLIAKDNTMSTLSGGIVMNNIKDASIDTSINADHENYLVITLAN
ncbi:PulJ/GspJ family protein [Acetobacterium sp.]|uniref:PulJ/GspJ family protein n=1 Tax=Acetobacterium sp. TaxID=1872094 RepID=UPI002F3FD305